MTQSNSEVEFVMDAFRTVSFFTIYTWLLSPSSGKTTNSSKVMPLIGIYYLYMNVNGIDHVFTVKTSGCDAVQQYHSGVI